MTLTRRKIFSLIGIFVLSAVIGGAIGESIGEYRASRFLGSFFSDGSNLSTILGIKEKVFILGELRDRKMEEAIETLEKALSTPGPVVIEAVIDPHEPPYPAKINLEQAEKMAEALAKGTPYRGKIMMTILSDKVRELL